ncbi:MAG: tetratricopeptide repeat protein [Dehalococcoidia bacterium]|nr:tetratricopeptide repeat protein [Dehalococcoidia bacterium]
MSKGSKQGLFIAMAAIVIVAFFFAITSNRTSSNATAGQTGAKGTQTADGQVDQATLDRIKGLEDTVKSGTKTVSVFTELGLLYFDAGELDKAAASFSSAIAIEPNNADLHVYLGLTYFWTGMTKEAMAEYQKAIVADPKAPDAYYQMALAQSHGQPTDIPGALANWKKVVELAPDSPMATKSKEYLDKYKDTTSLSGTAPPLGQAKP